MLSESVPKISGKGGRTGRLRLAPLVTAVVLGACSIKGWARFQPPPPCNNPFTHEQEITEGAKVAAQVYQQMPVLPDSDPVSQYVAQLGAHLASHAPGGSGAWPYNFHVVANADVNAFALPGGTMFVNLGTVQAVSTEAQLAGVMGHEISHVVMRHATCNMAKQQTKQVEYGIGSIFSQILLGNGAAGQIAQAGINGAEGLSFLKMSRDDEKQADLMGTDTLYDAGYDPRGLPQFFEVILAKYGAGGAQMLSDHPNPGNRTQYINDEIATLGPHPNAMVTSAVFTRIHNLARGEQTFTADQIKSGAWKNGNYESGPQQVGYGNNGGQYQVPPHQHPGDSPQYPNNGQQNGSGQYPNNGQQSAGQYPNGQQNGNGQYPNNSQNGDSPQYGNRGQQNSNGQSSYPNGSGPVALSGVRLGLQGRMANYSAADFTMKYPGRWTASPGQNGTVTFAPAGGAGNFGIVYGAMVAVVKVTGNGISDADSLAAATSQVIQQLSQQNGGLQQVGQLQTMTIGGQGANAVQLRGSSPLGDGKSAFPEYDWLVTVARPDGDLSYMIFVCPERDFPRLRTTFTSMMNSFRAAAVQ